MGATESAALLRLERTTADVLTKPAATKGNAQSHILMEVFSAAEGAAVGRQCGYFRRFPGFDFQDFDFDPMVGMYRLHRPFEPVAAAGKSFDVRGVALANRQRFADDGNVLGQVGFIHLAATPDGAHDFILGEDLAVVFDEHLEGFHYLAGEFNGLTALENNLRGWI